VFIQLTEIVNSCCLVKLHSLIDTLRHNIWIILTTSCNIIKEIIDLLS